MMDGEREMESELSVAGGCSCYISNCKELDEVYLCRQTPVDNKGSASNY